MWRQDCLSVVKDKMVYAARNLVKAGTENVFSKRAKQYRVHPDLTVEMAYLIVLRSRRSAMSEIAGRISVRLPRIRFPGLPHHLG